LSLSRFLKTETDIINMTFSGREFRSQKVVTGEERLLMVER